MTTAKIEVVEPIRRNLIILALRMLAVLFVADSVYALLLMGIVFGLVPASWTTSYATMLWLANLAKDVLLAYLLLTLVSGWFSTLYYVTGGHLIRQRGVFHVHESVFQLTDIEAVTVSQSGLGKIFNFGDLNLSFLIATEREEVMLYAINNPHRYAELFSKFV